MRARVGCLVLLLSLLTWYGGVGISVGKAQTFGPWSAPVNVGYPINTASNDTYAILSRDGLTMYFTSDRPGGLGGDDLWVAKRESLGDSWQTPTNLVGRMGEPINSAVNDSLPVLSSDEHVMFFYSTRGGGCGKGDIWMTRRHDARSEDWEAPVNPGCVLNTIDTEIAPAFFENPETGEVTLFYGSDRSGGLGDFDVYASAVGEDGYFGPGKLVREFSSPGRDTRIFIRKDGLEAFITSDRTAAQGWTGGQGGIDIWTSTRATLADAWSTPVDVGAPVDSPSDDGSPWLSKDGTTLYFFSTRVVDGVSQGKRDIWYTTRIKLDGE